jgi:hypothetical protein
VRGFSIPLLTRIRVLLLAASAAASIGCAASTTTVTPPFPTPSVTTPASSTLRQQWLDMFARGYFPGRSGQVFVVPKQTWFVTSRDPLYRFMHGSPWEYDTHIPLLLYGKPFIKTGQFSGPPDSRTLRLPLAR